MLILETERLRLRHLAKEDAVFLIELLNSPGWLEFIGDRNVKTEEQAIGYLENGPFKSYRDNGYGLWMVEIKEGELAAGICGIINRPLLENPDIGFAFLPAFMGAGYAHEIAAATLNYANQKLEIPVVSAITVTKNTRSIRLIEKLGLTFIRDFSFPESQDILSLYSQ
jgi:RimJ/RimL family protein N-acetyltransferase